MFGIVVDGSDGRFVKIRVSAYEIVIRRSGLRRRSFPNRRPWRGLVCGNGSGACGARRFRVFRRGNAGLLFFGRRKIRLCLGGDLFECRFAFCR
ncbi:MAG: hypothetical protein IJN19_01790 [Opitutales bacterium]|nr:hypothetical protein [Opitutales bacterium]